MSKQQADADKRRVLAPAVIPKLQALRAQGMSYTAIARAMGVGYATVYRAINAIGSYRAKP